ncbi:MAG: c-type cytochrome domain-containing protein [Phaeodactylibacter sp.]|uniref:c-type cytochrome domain-containing protein n=1 Tax=Phaeodactylibacter sp. TaxID=1940289 RepID=UPI0032EE392C
MEWLPINIARLHPLIVHLPIGFLLLGMLMEGLQRWQKHNNYQPAIGLSLLLGTLASIVAAATGWWLAEEGGYEENLLQYHRWLGIATVVSALLLYLGHKAYVPLLAKAYPHLLWVCGAVLFAAGHFGGAMTHGTDYLFERPVAPQKVEDIEEALVYDIIIQPIMDQKCTGCHKPSKSKGGLLLTDQAGLMAGGDSGPLFNTAIPAQSLLLERVHLPMEVEEHMPPEGKPQLSEGEIQLLEWWMINGACFDCKVGDVEDRAAVATLLEAYQAPADHWAKLYLQPLPLETVQKLNAQGLRVEVAAEDSPFLLVNMARDTALNTRSFAPLSKYAGRVIELHCGYSNFSDALADQLTGFTNLKKLQLQGSRITDEGLSVLPKLPHLQVLNLYGTAVTDASLEHIDQLPGLQHLYLWQTDISETGLSEWMKAHPQVIVQREADREVFGTAALNPPLIEAPSTLFHDSMVIRAVSNFKGVRVHYTLDGTPPDAASPVFPDSLVLRETAEIRAFALKEGWNDSEVEQARFVKAGLRAARGELLNPPSGKFQAQGGASLVDLQKGTEVFTAGNWLGYEGEHMSAVMELPASTLLSELTISALSRPASWIFFPKGAIVFVSSDGRRFREVARADWPAIDKDVAEAELKYFPIEFEPVDARYVKVEVRSPLRNPDWHPNPGGKSWIFLDEILLSGPESAFNPGGLQSSRVESSNIK